MSEKQSSLRQSGEIIIAGKIHNPVRNLSLFQFTTSYCLHSINSTEIKEMYLTMDRILLLPNV